MPLDIGAFKNALSHFPSGVTVVTTLDAQGKPWGFTASAFTSLSLDPPLVLVCLDRRADSHDTFFSAEHYAVSILSADQLPIALRFATKEIEKFGGFATTNGSETGVPLIPGALVHLECRMHQTFPVGDHTILIGYVLAAGVSEGEPLLYHNRQWGVFQAKPLEAVAP